jgi:hypothetical protein
MVKKAVCAAGDEFGNKIRRAAGHLSQGHAETEKIFGVHVLIQTLQIILNFIRVA